MPGQSVPYHAVRLDLENKCIHPILPRQINKRTIQKYHPQFDLLWTLLKYFYDTVLADLMGGSYLPFH